jgi:hypothetical protein
VYDLKCLYFILQDKEMLASDVNLQDKEILASDVNNGCDTVRSTNLEIYSDKVNKFFFFGIYFEVIALPIYFRTINLVNAVIRSKRVDTKIKE